MITLNGASIAWASKMIPAPSMSSAEAETAAAVMLVKKILSARLLLWRMKLASKNPFIFTNEHTTHSTNLNRMTSLYRQD